MAYQKVTERPAIATAFTTWSASFRRYLAAGNKTAAAEIEEQFKIKA